MRRLFKFSAPWARKTLGLRGGYNSRIEYSWMLCVLRQLFKFFALWARKTLGLCGGYNSRIEQAGCCVLCGGYSRFRACGRGNAEHRAL